MPGLALFDEKLLARRKKIIGHPLCSSRTRDFLAALTARVMLHDDSAALERLITEVNRLTSKFDALQLAWNELPQNTKIALGKIFEDGSTTRETKQYFLTELTRLSQEPEDIRSKGIKEITRYCRDIQETQFLGRALHFAVSH